MATKDKTSRGTKSPPAPNGNGAHRNGANGNGAHSNGNGNGNGNGAADAAEARRIATQIGSAVLIASSLETARHSDDVELIAGAIAERLGLPGPDRADILAGARLHDIGKASISREILEKPAELTSLEWEVMRTHTIVGEDILSSVKELEGIASLVRHSHERWDGSGYPDGLAGEEIPLGSRIIFCADAFHAIRSDRAYRKGVSAAQALEEVRRCAGTQFDPQVVVAFEQVVREQRLVPATGRRTKRSSRLAALLLCLALGGGGSAAAEMGLFGEPDTAPSAPPVRLDCDSFYCHFLTPVTISGGTILGSKHLSTDATAKSNASPDSPLVGDAGAPVGGNSPSPPLLSAPTTAGPPGEAVADTPGATTPGKDDAGNSTGSGGSDVPAPTVTPPTPSKDKNPNANGNGWAHGHDKPGHGSHGSADGEHGNSGHGESEHGSSGHGNSGHGGGDDESDGGGSVDDEPSGSSGDSDESSGHGNSGGGHGHGHGH
jgi:putative nucleotidyltransferase with HDIG domain